jgi:prepilin-type N-terminal cleavage/methylation domain-containing protein
MKQFNFFKNRDMNHRAFTLVELLVVISIIGLLSSIATVSLSSSRARGRDIKRIADLKQVRIALEAYAIETGAYPTCGQACAEYCDCTTVGWGANWANMEIKPSYIGNMPVDPTNTSAYGYFYARGYKATGNCIYVNTNLPTDYILATNLEKPTTITGSCPGGFSAWGRNLNFLSGVGL